MFKYFKDLDLNVSNPDGRRKENKHDPDLVCENNNIHIKSLSKVGDSWVFQKSSLGSTGICCLVEEITEQMLNDYLNKRCIIIEIFGFISIETAEKIFKPMKYERFNQNGPNGKCALYRNDVLSNKDFQPGF